MLPKIAALGALLISGSSALPQGPNTVAVNNHNVRTQAMNGTWFLVPVDRNIVQKSSHYPLLPLPTDDETLFPHGFPVGMHPILVGNFYGSDIRLVDLYIDALLGGSVYIPFVDRLKDGETPFTYPLKALTGGTNGQSLMGLVPAIVGALTGSQDLEEGQFDPDNAAWSTIGPNEYSTQGKVTIVPNPLSGPGVIGSLYEIDFSTATDPLYTIHTFHSVLNQPLIQNNGKCFRNAIYFNETFAEQTLREGTITLYSPPLPTGFQGVYKKVGGFSGAGENIGYNPQSCAIAAAYVDSAAAN